MSSTHLRRPIYSREYATHAVNEFVQSYARATKDFAKIVEADAKKVVAILIETFMYSNHRWNTLRDLIKWLNKPERVYEIMQYEYKDRVKYLTSVKTLVEDYVIFEENTYSSIDNS